MKKSLVALATLAVATGAMAQSGMARSASGSNVEIFGVFDATVTRLSADGAGSVIRMQGEGRNESSRLGLRGTEDMGGGWAAGFWLEAGMFVESGGFQNTTSNNTAYGQTGISTSASNAAASPDVVSLGAMQGLTFNRASTVSLINSQIGELRLGRDYTPTFWNKTLFDPFGTVGVGAYTNLTYGTLNKYVAVAPPGNPTPQVRASNSLGWLSQNMNGFRIQVQHALSEQLSGCTDVQVADAGANADNGGNLCQSAAGSGKYTGFRLTYVDGPLTLAAAQGKTDYPYPMGSASRGVVTGYQGGYKDANFAAAYQLGNTRLLGQYGIQNFGSTNTNYASGINASVAPAAPGAVWTGTPAATGSTYANGILSTSERTLKTTMLGITHAMGPWTLKGSYGTAKVAGGQLSASTSRNLANFEDGSKSKQIALGAVYDLSKRTALYGTYSKLTTTGQNTTASMGVASAAAVGLGGSNTATGLDLGVRHRF
ncbi:MAG: porin [Alphaproteobacteria bacterium]|nr:porin [Alphaproteobacteria bacterium]